MKFNAAVGKMDRRLNKSLPLLIAAGAGLYYVIVYKAHDLGTIIASDQMIFIASVAVIGYELYTFSRCKRSKGRAC